MMRQVAWQALFAAVAFASVVGMAFYGLASAVSGQGSWLLLL